jgi:hypothetical protein
MGEQTNQNLEDRLAIRELAERYCDATTRGDWAALESVWMPDGVWEEHAPFNGRQVGIKEIITQTRAMLDATDVFIQVCYGVVIHEITADSARAHAMVQGIARGGFGSNINFVIFKDRLVRSNGVWRYAERDLHNIYVDTQPLDGTRMMSRADLAAFSVT